MARKKAKAQLPPEVLDLIGEIGHVFDEAAERLEGISEATEQKRARFSEALETVQRTGAEAGSLRDELEGLPLALAAADLDGDEEEKGRLRERRKELLAELEALEAERREALVVFGGLDPWQARSVEYQRASLEADAVVSEARERRDALVEAASAACENLEETARRLHKLRRAHTMTKGAS